MNRSMKWNDDRTKVVVENNRREEFTPDALKGIKTDLENQKSLAEQKLKHLKDIKHVLDQMDAEPRFKETIEAVLLIEGKKMHDRGNIESGIRQVSEDINKLAEDIDALKEFVKEEV